VSEYGALTRRGQIQFMRRVAERALALYGIEARTLSLLNHVFNTTFTVIGPDSALYVLHILRPLEDASSEARERARVESELWWLDEVRTDVGVVVPVPVRTPDGAGVVAVEDVTPPRLCTRFHWVDGRFLRHRFTPAQLEAVGRLTARLHQHSTHLRVPAWFDRPRVDRADVETEERVARLFAGGVSGAAAAVIHSAFQQVRAAQHQLGETSDTFGLIHADIHQMNYLFHDGDMRLIDFGDCGWGHYLYDLAVTLSELEGLPRYAQLRAALLAGYRQVRDLSPAHEGLIDTFVLLRHVQNVTWFVTVRDDPSYRDRAAQIDERVAVIGRLVGTAAPHIA
jgi:Ser/Thr protein kinase RdoA (MazF antagonist)